MVLPIGVCLSPPLITECDTSQALRFGGGLRSTSAHFVVVVVVVVVVAVVIVVVRLSIFITGGVRFQML